MKSDGFYLAIVTATFENWSYNRVGEIVFVTIVAHDKVPEDEKYNYMLKCAYYDFKPRSYTKGYKIDWLIVSNPESSFWKLIYG